MGEVVLKLSGVSKAFGTVRALDSLSLEIHKGEVLTLLGSSGCGKTTTLRVVAGLEEPDEGEIYYRATPIVSVRRHIFTPAYKRDMGMVFQSYALWPNMTVAENVAFPLRVRKVPSGAIREKVGRALELVNLGHVEKRLVPLLSGGQQQRVALARALVYEPDLLLLDEPFSNLDAKLREQMRVELKLLQRKLAISVLFVTHDQVEALSLSDRVAVINEGRIEQLASPCQLYESPRTPFVRDFLGKTIILKGRVEARENQSISVVVDGTSRRLCCRNDVSSEVRPGQNVCVAIRPEDVAPCLQERPNGNSLKGVIETYLFVGDHYEVSLCLENGERILFYLSRAERWEEGREIYVTFPQERTSVWMA